MLLAFMGLHFNGDVDATGIATVLLAIATFALALYTRRSVKQNALELEQSQRPVMVPFADPAVRPRIEHGHFLLPVINVGVGPAMQILAQVEFRDIQGKPTAAGQVRAAATRTAVGANQQTLLAFEGVALTSVMGFVYDIEFEDVSGKRWLSQGSYSEADHAFSDVVITERAATEAMRRRVMTRFSATEHAH